VIALVHDAVLLEVPVDQLDLVGAQAVECLKRASRCFLHGLTLRADAKPVLPGERFADGRGAKTWSFVERSLHELTEGCRHVG
jgi:DNA polymerase I